MKEKNDDPLEQLTFRVSTSMIREIDAAWTKRGIYETRSQGIRWLIRKGLDAVKKEVKK